MANWIEKKNGRENRNETGNGNEIVLTLFFMNQSEKKILHVYKFDFKGGQSRSLALNVLKVCV